MIRVDVSDFDRFADRLEAVARRIPGEIDRGLRDAADELDAGGVVAEGARSMPSRGGLAALLGSGGTLRVSQTGQGVEVEVGHASVSLSPIDGGRLRHPTFGRLPMVTQPVPSGSFSGALAEQAGQAIESAVEPVRLLLEGVR